MSKGQANFFFETVAEPCEKGFAILTLKDGQGVRRQLVDFEHKPVLDADKIDKAMMGFNLSWDDTWHVVNPRVVRDLSLAMRAADCGGKRV